MFPLRASDRFFLLFLRHLSGFAGLLDLRLAAHHQYVDDKDEEQMAHKKGHTHLKSIVKALNELGDDVKCEQIVLTHFSMKYSEKHILETLESEIPERFRERVIAFI